MKTKIAGLIFLLLLPLFSFAKGGKKPGKVPLTYYYMGEIEIHAPDGTGYGKYVALTKQIVDKKAKTITTQVISIDQKGESKEYNYTIHLRGGWPGYALFKILAADSSYKGSGIFTGMRWKWYKWKYTMTYTTAPGKMISYNRVRWNGLHVKSIFYGADGKATLEYREIHRPVSKEVFEIIYLQVLK
jgi:hypothetical protein